MNAIDRAGIKVGRALERKVIKRARQAVERGALNAARINDNGLDDQGSEVILSEREKRIAMDMRKSKRNAPVYIEVLLRRTENAEKLSALRDQGPKVALNVGQVVLVQPVAYPVRQLDDQKDDR